ncbi:hypothetical protein PIB30_097714, partial [Stylosanthes scabra]|nr:hypothetical protein [Stylosanthes scabra]
MPHTQPIQNLIPTLHVMFGSRFKRGPKCDLQPYHELHSSFNLLLTFRLRPKRDPYVASPSSHPTPIANVWATPNVGFYTHHLSTLTKCIKPTPSRMDHVSN